MTVSALEAQTLDDCLRERGDGDLSELWRNFFGRAAKAVAEAWLMTVTEDFRHPGVAGTRPRGSGVMNWYTGRIYEAAVYDAYVYRSFLQVLTMLRPPASLLGPRLLLRVMSGGRGGGRRPKV